MDSIIRKMMLGNQTPGANQETHGPGGALEKCIQNMILALLATLPWVRKLLSMVGRHTLSLAKCFVFLQCPLSKKGTVDMNRAHGFE